MKLGKHSCSVCCGTDPALHMRRVSPYCNQPVHQQRALDPGHLHMSICPLHVMHQQSREPITWLKVQRVGRSALHSRELRLDETRRMYIYLVEPMLTTFISLWESFKLCWTC